MVSEIANFNSCRCTMLKIEERCKKNSATENKRKIILNKENLLLHDGSNFVIIDSGAKGRMFIVCTSQDKQMVNSREKCFKYRTFRSCGSQLVQLYVQFTRTCGYGEYI